jgi:hypothetical protein
MKTAGEFRDDATTRLLSGGEKGDGVVPKLALGPYAVSQLALDAANFFIADVSCPFFARNLLPSHSPRHGTPLPHTATAASLHGASSLGVATRLFATPSRASTAHHPRAVCLIRVIESVVYAVTLFAAKMCACVAFPAEWSVEPKPHPGHTQGRWQGVRMCCGVSSLLLDSRTCA